MHRICGQIGYPKTIRFDQGSEFISRDMNLWDYQRGVTLDLSRPGKPTDTDVIEKPSMPSADLFWADFATER